MSATLLNAVTKRIATGDYELVPMPAGLVELLMLVGVQAPGGGVEMGSLERVVARDPALAAQTLRAANAPAIATTSANTLREAMLRLGSRKLSRLALSLRPAALREASIFEGRIRKISAHARLTAVFAANMGPMWGQDADVCFLAGLQHSIGALALLRLIEVEAARLRVTAVPAIADGWVAEWQVQVGMELALAWRLPEAVVATIRGLDEDAPDSLTAQVVSVASALAAEPGMTERDLRDRLVAGRTVGALDLEHEAMLAWMELTAREE